MINEFAIHLVNRDNQGKDLSGLNNLTLQTIARAFGGFTVTEARGGWINNEGKLYDEPVLRVLIACENTPENSGKLKQIALNYKAEAGQEAVYIKAFDGAVLFV